MTADELKAAADRAQAWLADPPLPGVVTRHNAQREDHMALDVVQLLAHVAKLEAERDEARAALLNRAAIVKAAKESASALRLADESAWVATDAALCRAVDELARVEARDALAPKETP